MLFYCCHVRTFWAEFNIYISNIKKDEQLNVKDICANECKYEEKHNTT